MHSVHRSMCVSEYPHCAGHSLDTTVLCSKKETCKHVPKDVTDMAAIVLYNVMRLI